MAVEKLTVKRCEALSRTGTPVLVRDEVVRGLMFRVGKGGTASWVFQRDLWQDKTVRTVKKALGKFPAMGLDEARAVARGAISTMEGGANPFEKRPELDAGPDRWSLSEAWTRYRAAKDLAASTAEGYDLNVRHYLGTLLSRPLGSLRKSEMADLHRKITAASGPYPANSAMRTLRAIWLWAKKHDDHGAMSADHPVLGVTFNPERVRNDEEFTLLPEELPEWSRRIAALPSPLRRRMHLLGLYTGLRPGLLVRLEKAWVQDDRLRVPRQQMKVRDGDGDFIVPFSPQIRSIVDRALSTSDLLYPGSPWLFPTRLRDGTTGPTQVWKEKSMPGWTGYCLRKAYRSRLAALGCPHAIAGTLLDHRQPGISHAYISTPALFATMHEWQCKASNDVDQLLDPQVKT